MTNLMKAWAQQTKGGPEVLEITQVPKPTATGSDLLVKIYATAVNPVDGKARDGLFGVAPGKIVGYDAAGVVESVGEHVKHFKIGDEVYFAGDITRQGANAEYALVDERITGRKPMSLNWEQAASVPLCALTAWESLVESAHVPVPGNDSPNGKKSILVIGGSGGVGSILIQIVKKVLKFGKIIATASRPETVEWCKRLGADEVINHNNLKEDLAKLGLATGVNYVFVTSDLAPCWDAVVDILSPNGTIIGITGFLGVTAHKMFLKRGTLIAGFMFARPMHNDEPEKQGEILNRVGEWIDQGVLVHTQNQHFEWDQLREAQKFQDSGKAIGKITLSVKF